MNKRFFLILLILLFITSFTANAFFTPDHLYWTLTGFDDIDSPIADMCRPHIDVVLDGNTGADVPILHYFDEDTVASYIGTHAKGSGYFACLERAGSDVESRCFCHGQALHLIQDSFAHNENGVVPKYLKQDFASNFVGHMVIESSFVNKHMALVESREEPVVVDGRLEFYDSIVLDNLFEETGGNPKYLQLLNEMSGIDDMSNDARLFRSGYQGEGFFNTVYKDKVSLPFWGWALGIGLAIVGIGVMLVLVFTGVNFWKWVAALPWFILAVIGIVLVSSFVAGTTWQITTVLIEIPPKIGLLEVSNEDIVLIDRAVQEATNEFLRTGNVPIEDASGLSYVNSEGVFVEGALSQAETSFKFVLLPTFLILFALLCLSLAYNAYGNKNKILSNLWWMVLVTIAVILFVLSVLG